MNWFGGGIPEAIGLAKSTNAIFVVYIHDSSEASKTTDETLAQKEVATVLSSNKFVAIKLENGTEPANQFSQIYPVVLLPSLYFISGSTGMPLEILGGAVSEEKLKEKLNQLSNGPEGAAEKQQQEPSVSAPEEMSVDEPNAPEEMSVDEPNELPVHPSTSNAKVETPATSETTSAASALVDSSQVPEASENAMDNDGAIENKDDDDNLSSEVSLEERVERAKNLLAEKQAKKAEESAEDDKKKEIDRRKMGQEIAKRKRQMQEEEIQSLVRERKKEKDEDRAARERIRAQIAADRLEAQARAALFKEEPSSASAQEPPRNVGAAAASAAPAPNKNCTVTRIKFRLLDGSSSVAEFPVEATLADVRRHVQQQLVSSSGFSLTSTVHQHPFTPQDNDVSLSNLGLVPSAILIVSNSSGSGSGSLVPSQGGVMQFLWIILSPITFILGFVRQLFSSISGRGTGSSSSTTQAGSSQTTNQQRPATAYGRRENRLNREGNIYRLHNSNDDDENNTWNGNSTQQM